MYSLKMLNLHGWIYTILATLQNRKLKKNEIPESITNMRIDFNMLKDAGLKRFEPKLSFWIYLMNKYVFHCTQQVCMQMVMVIRTNC